MKPSYGIGVAVPSWMSSSIVVAPLQSRKPASRHADARTMVEPSEVTWTSPETTGSSRWTQPNKRSGIMTVTVRMDRAEHAREWQVPASTRQSRYVPQVIERFYQAVQQLLDRDGGPTSPEELADIGVWATELFGGEPLERIRELPPRAALAELRQRCLDAATVR